MRMAENMPLLGLETQKIIKKAGVHGIEMVFSGPQDTDFIISQEMVKGVSFTGSTPAGKIIAGIAGSHLKQMCAELGGSDPFVVLEDANLDLAVELALRGRGNNAGQTCIAPKRYLIHKNLYNGFVEKLVQGVNNLKLGDPLLKETQMGP